MEIFETLVQLASIGTAGISILAIFLIWRSIHTLPDSSPNWKVKLMYRYQNFCLFMAVICALSGGANAYFNASKTAEAAKQAADLAAAYDEQQNKFLVYQMEMTQSLEQIQQDLANTKATSTSGQIAMLENFQTKLRAMNFKPLDSIVTEQNQEKFGIKSKHIFQ